MIKRWTAVGSIVILLQRTYCVRIWPDGGSCVDATRSDRIAGSDPGIKYGVHCRAESILAWPELSKHLSKTRTLPQEDAAP